MAVVPVIVTQRPVAFVRICLHGWGPFKLGVIPDEGEQLVVGDVKRGELGGSLFFLAVLGGAFGPYFDFLSVQAGSLWQLCRSGQLSLPFVRRPEYYPPELSIYLPTDTVLPWWQVGQGKGMEERSSRPKASSEVL